MVVTLSGIIISVSDVQFLNAFDPIEAYISDREISDGLPSSG